MPPNAQASHCLLVSHLLPVPHRATNCPSNHEFGRCRQAAKRRVYRQRIIGMINASPCSFDTSTDGVIALKNAGVHQHTVVLGNHQPHECSRPSKYPVHCRLSPAPDDPDDPMAPHRCRRLPHGRRSPRQTKNGVYRSRRRIRYEGLNLMGAAFSFGAAKMKLKAQIPGPHAALRTTQNRPVFSICTFRHQQLRSLRRIPHGLQP